MAKENVKDEMMLEFGKWLMDVAKYVLTAVIISTIFQGYCFSMGIAALWRIAGGSDASGRDAPRKEKHKNNNN